MWFCFQKGKQNKARENPKTPRLVEATRARINYRIFIYYIIYFIMADNKQKIISDIYFDRAGFQSKANTLKDAREKDKNIKMSDVEQFLKKC